MDVPWPGYESVEALAEEFNKSAKAIDHQLDDISRSMRFDHMAVNKEEAMERELREAERRRREVEMRKARKREQAARNPQKKVALRLENTRRFDHDASQNKNIPIQRIDVVGIKGSEMVEVVDVRMLKSRCLGFNEGASVHSLLEVLQTREQKAKLLSASMPSINAPSRADSQGSSASRQAKARNYQERREKVCLQRDVQHFGKIASRLTAMRGVKSQILPYDFEESVNQRIMLMSDAPWSDRVDAMDRVVSSFRPRHKAPPARDSAARQKGRGRAEEQAVLRAQSRRFWAIVRALMWWSVVLKKVQRRNNAISIVKASIAQYGEWTRLRYTMHHLNKAVCILQARVRTFLARKRERLDIMTAQWQRIEDAHLEAFCMSYANEVLREKYGSEGQAPQFLMSGAQESKMKGKHLMHQKLKEGIFKFNWKKFRIPAEDRRTVLSRYYVVLLKKRLRIQTNIVDMMRRIVQSQREMVCFLNQFGAEMKTSQSLSFEDKQVQPDSIAPPPFWHLNEKVVLQLIALCAKDLKEQEIEPFQEHPSHKDLPGNVMYRRSIQEASMLLADVGSGRITAADHQQQRSRLTGPRVSVRAKSESMKLKKAWTRKHGQRTDIEEVFGLFTPRLREITEKQSLEYRTSNPARAATPLAAVA